MDEWKGEKEPGFQWGHLILSPPKKNAALFFTICCGLDEVCWLWCVSPPSPLTPVWIFPFGSVRFQNGPFRRRSTHPLWRQCRRRRERRTGRCERGSPGWWRSGWPEGLQAVDGPESPDNGHLQPEPRQTKLLHCQPLPLHLPRGQSHQEVRKADNRVAISFPDQLHRAQSRCICSLITRTPLLGNRTKMFAKQKQSTARRPVCQAVKFARWSGL